MGKTEDLTQGHTLVYTNMKCVGAVHVVTGVTLHKTRITEGRRRDVIDGVGTEKKICLPPINAQEYFLDS